MNDPRLRVRSWALIGAAFVLAGALFDGADAQQAPDPELEELEMRALGLLNGERLAAGLPALRLSESLSLLARRQSREQSELGRVSHHSYEFNLSSERRLRISFPTAPLLGENVARNRSVEHLHAALMRSAGHRRNRMDPEFTHVGIGLARAGEYVLYMTEVFVGVAPGDELDEPVAYYFNAAPGSYESREDPRAELGTEIITIEAPGPDNPQYWTSLGIEAFNDSDLETAARHFRRALELYPEYDYARYNLARTLLYQGGYEEATTLLDGLLASNPDDLDARATLGNLALLQQSYAAAEAAFRRVIKARDNDAAAWYNLGLALEYQDRPREAELAYQRAVRIEPGMLAAQAALGRVRRR